MTVVVFTIFLTRCVVDALAAFNSDPFMHQLTELTTTNNQHIKLMSHSTFALVFLWEIIPTLMVPPPAPPPPLRCCLCAERRCALVWCALCAVRCALCAVRCVQVIIYFRKMPPTRNSLCECCMPSGAGASHGGSRAGSGSTSGSTSTSGAGLCACCFGGAQAAAHGAALPAAQAHDRSEDASINVCMAVAMTVACGAVRCGAMRC